MRYLVVVFTFLLSVTFYGQNDYSMSFDGVDDYIMINHSSSIDVSNSISIGFLMKPNSWTAGDENCIVSKKYGDNNNGFVIYNDGNVTPSICFRIEGSNGPLQDYGESDAQVDIGVWQHWYFVYNSSSSVTTIYKNGQLDTTRTSINVGDMSTSSDLYIALVQHPSWNGFYEGLLDDITLWDIPLTSQEIQNYISCPPSGNEEGLVGYWNFEEGSGTTAYDQTANGNDGAINGATYSTDVPDVNCNINQECSDIDLLIFQQTGLEEVTENAINQYQADNPLTNTNINLSTAVLATNQEACNSMAELLSGKDVVLFLGGVSTDNCNWVDIMPQLDQFVRNGGDIIMQGQNTYDFMFNTDQWESVLGQDPWFQSLSAEQYWCCGFASINANCNSGNTFFGSDYGSHPIFSNVYDYTNGNQGGECDMFLLEPWWYSVSTIDFDDPSFFSIYNSGGDAIGGEVYGENTQLVFGKMIGEGNVILFGDNNPLATSYSGSQNLLGNIIHYFNTGDNCSDSTVNTVGCMDETACNFDADAVEDDGSCEYITPVDLGEDITTCDESVTLDAGEGYESYLWSNGETTQSIDVSESGDYSVEVGDGNNYSMSFDGDAYVNNFNSNNLAVTGDLSLCFNILVSELVNSSTHVITFGEGGESNSENILYTAEFPPNSSELYYTHEYNSGINIELPSNFILYPNQWYNVIMTRDTQSQEVKIFIDGSETSSFIYSDNPNGGEAGYFSIADDFGEGNFNGLLDDIQIWNQVLSQDEINEYINCPPTGNEEGLLGYWDFEEGSGATAYDQTSNGNDGTINGATWSDETPEQNCSFCSSSDEISVTINVCGCTDSEAVNYNIEANEDDSSCCYDIDYVNDTYDEGYADGVDSVICPENNCPSDLTLDGIVSTADLLMFLVSFGTICE